MKPATTAFSVSHGSRRNVDAVVLHILLQKSCHIARPNVLDATAKGTKRKFRGTAGFNNSTSFVGFEVELIPHGTDSARTATPSEQAG